METALISPADASVFFMPTAVFSFIIPIIGVIVFTYIMARRLAPLVLAAPDARFDRIRERVMQVLKIWEARCVVGYVVTYSHDLAKVKVE